MIETEKKKRVRRTPEERAAAEDLKIQKFEEDIAGLEEKKQAAIAEFDTRISAKKQKIQECEAEKKRILSPKLHRKPRKTKKQKMTEILKQAQKSGMKPEEIAEKLGVELEK